MTRAAADPVTADCLGGTLSTRWLGRNCSCFASVASTQDVARRLAEAGAPDGAIVVADAQTTGRGRQGRRWSSPSGLGIACSTILPALESSGATALLVGAGVRAGLAACGVEGLAVKWPNDVVGVSGASDRPREWDDATARSARKLAGILVETVSGSDGRLVAGIGINVHQREDDFPPEVRDVATSVRILGERDYRRRELLSAVLGEIERRLDLLRDGTRDDARRLVEEWRASSSVVGRAVTIGRGDGIAGVAQDIQADGALVIEVDGVRRPIYSGTVRLAPADAVQ